MKEKWHLICCKLHFVQKCSLTHSEEALICATVIRNPKLFSSCKCVSKIWILRQQWSLYLFYYRITINCIKIKFWIHFCIELNNLGFLMSVAHINASSEWVKKHFWTNLCNLRHIKCPFSFILPLNWHREKLQIGFSQKLLERFFSNSGFKLSTYQGKKNINVISQGHFSFPNYSRR